MFIDLGCSCSPPTGRFFGVLGFQNSEVRGEEDRSPGKDAAFSQTLEQWEFEKLAYPQPNYKERLENNYYGPL